MLIRIVLSPLGVILLGCMLPASNGFAQAANGKKLYLLQDAADRQWCAFGRESAWKSEVQSRSALLVATVEYAGSRISTVSVTDEDETGDWIVYDTYSLDGGGALRTLSRTINVLPGDRSQKEVFLMRNGRASRQSVTSLSLSTGKVATSAVDWLPSVPVITSVQAFPFSSLIGSKRFEAWSKGSVCAAANQP
jgi:hypothetical protein